MILTLTLNPAIDVSLATDRIVYDDRTFITQEAEHPGGKGINAAQVIHSYGGAAHAVAPYGGERGRRFARLLEAARIPTTLIPVQGETRRNYAITDSQGLTIKLDQVGAELSPEELQRIEAAVLEKLPKAEWLMLTGSRPPGVPDDFYACMIKRARENNVQTLLDTTGEALPLGLAAGPTLAKPNRPEAERLLDQPILSQAQSAIAAREIRKMGADSVIVSLGSQGAVAAWKEGLLRAAPPTFQTGCPIGAGDVLAATCVWALCNGESFPEALKWAVAAATTAAAMPGVSFGSLEEVQKMRRQIEIHSI